MLDMVASDLTEGYIKYLKIVNPRIPAMAKQKASVRHETDKAVIATIPKLCG
jgi:hypothetical protein